MEQCTDAESAIHKLTRQRFEAVIVDCADQRTASRVLRSARTAPLQQARRGSSHPLSGQTGGRRVSIWGPISFFISRSLRNAPRPASAPCEP